MTLPLADLVVVELCDSLGQYAGKLLADMGADVIKVEPPQGSSARSIGPFVGDEPGRERSLNFWYYNTNKRSIVLDIQHNDEDRAALRKLISRADIVLEDRPPGELADLGLDYEGVRNCRDDIVMCSISPFGQSGPWKDFKTSDLVSLALGGPMAMNGYDEDDVPSAPPIRPHGDQGYNTGCYFAVIGVLAAIAYRDRTGLGQHVDCSVHEALSGTVENGMVHYLYRRRDVFRQTGRHAALRKTEPVLFPTATPDTFIAAFGIGRDNEGWREIKRWVQASGFGLDFDDARFDKPQVRQFGSGAAEAGEIAIEMARFFKEHTANEIYRGGQARRQAWGIVRAPGEAFDDEHWREREFFVQTTGEGVPQGALMPGTPYLFRDVPRQLRSRAPRLDEHRNEILAAISEER